MSSHRQRQAEHPKSRVLRETHTYLTEELITISRPYQEQESGYLAFDGSFVTATSDTKRITAILPDKYLLASQSLLLAHKTLISLFKENRIKGAVVRCTGLMKMIISSGFDRINLFFTLEVHDAEVVQEPDSSAVDIEKDVFPTVEVYKKGGIARQLDQIYGGGGASRRARSPFQSHVTLESEHDTGTHRPAYSLKQQKRPHKRHRKHKVVSELPSPSEAATEEYISDDDFERDDDIELSDPDQEEQAIEDLTIMAERSLSTQDEVDLIPGYPAPPAVKPTEVYNMSLSPDPTPLHSMPKQQTAPSHKSTTLDQQAITAQEATALKQKIWSKSSPKPTSTTTGITPSTSPFAPSHEPSTPSQRSSGSGHQSSITHFLAALPTQHLADNVDKLKPTVIFQKDSSSYIKERSESLDSLDDLFPIKATTAKDLPPKKNSDTAAATPASSLTSTMSNQHQTPEPLQLRTTPRAINKVTRTYGTSTTPKIATTDTGVFIDLSHQDTQSTSLSTSGSKKGTSAKHTKKKGTKASFTKTSSNIPKPARNLRSSD